MNKYSSVHTLKDGGVNSTVTAHILISHDWPSSTVQGNLPTVVSSTHTRTSTLSPTHTTGNWQFSAEQYHPGANHFPGYFPIPPFWVRSWPALSAFVQPPSSSSIETSFDTLPGTQDARFFCIRPVLYIRWIYRTALLRTVPIMDALTLRPVVSDRVPRCVGLSSLPLQPLRRGYHVQGPRT